MKAIRVNEWGKAVQLEDVPQPAPADDEVLVRVHAASINPFDVAVVAGYVAFMAAVPLTVGTDFAGEVVKAGKDVTHIKPGDEVYGLSILHSGTFAEYTTPKAHEVALKPRSLDYVQAAAIPLAATAAWQTLFDTAQLKNGERLLIQGVGGSVGTYALQFAKSAGAYVYGTDIPERRNLVNELGLDRYINPKQERLQDIVKDVDAVLDLVGGDLVQESYSVLRRGGRYVGTLALQMPQEEPERLGIHSFGFGAQPKAELLAKFADLVDTGQLKVIVNRTFPLEQAAEAMDFRGKTPVPGKVVLTVIP
jgi:NADPH:quinone reductase-like Zn-dependent oxidoreductase